MAPDAVIMDPAHHVEILAREHAEHLRWLTARHGRTHPREALEEALQESYAKALTALGRTPAPTFRDHDAARAWLRRIADRAVVDAVRAREGRRPGTRPPTVPLDDEADLPAVAAEAEDSVLGEAERDHEVQVIARAIRELSDDHQRILRWRYKAGLEPDAIARLERINARQYEGRHYRAMAALRAAVAALDLGTGCRETRRHLRRRPGGLIDPSARRARVHVESCTACRAFERKLRGALGLVPLSPAAVALELVGRPGAGAAGSGPAVSEVTTTASAAAPAPTAGAVTFAKAMAAIAASILVAASAASSIAGGGRAPTEAPAARGEGTQGARLQTLARHSAKLHLEARANSRVGSARGVR